MSDFDPDRSADPNAQRRVRATPVQARQGREGRPVLYVLIAGLALALLAWAAVELYPRGTSRTASGTGPAERVAPVEPPGAERTASIPAPSGTQAPARPQGGQGASQESAPAASDSAR